LLGNAAGCRVSAIECSRAHLPGVSVLLKVWSEDHGGRVNDAWSFMAESCNQSCAEKG
jgi:hypothetical protein